MKILKTGWALGAILILMNVAPCAVAQEFSKLQGSYQNARDGIDDERKANRKALLDRYSEIVEGLQQRFQSGGKLNEALAAKAEIDRAKMGKFTPLPSNAAPELLSANSVAKSEILKIEQQHNRKLLSLVEKYTTSLENLQKNLVIAGKLEEAKTVSEESIAISELFARLQQGGGNLGVRRELSPAMRKDLIFYFPLDEAEGELIEDANDSEFNGRFEGTSFVEEGLSNGARSFNGLRDRIALTSQLPDSEELTISVWIKYEGNETSGGIFSDYDGRSGNDLMFALVGPDKVHIRADKGAEGRLNAI
ncbi:MAG: hypothetical protein AAF585_02745 [Verrucomicrobiota bacterium]